MKTINIIAIPFIFALASSPSFPDMSDVLQNSTAEQRASLQTQYMKERLKISGEPAEKINKINLKFAQKTDSILKGDGGQMSKMMKIKAIMSDKDNEFKAVMSPEQYEAYEDSKDDLKAYMESHLGKK